MEASFHESDDRLELYALGRLSDSDLIGVEEHLLACDVCRDRLDESANVAFAMRETLKNHPAPSYAGRFEWLKVGWLRPQFALAGAMAMAVLAVILVWHGNSRMTPVASLQLTAMRGAEIHTVPAAREIDITFGDAARAISVEVVDESGNPVWNGTPEMVGKSVQAKIVKALPAGDYFARVYDSPGHLLHEYGFRVKK
jgi:hypothetical protein